MGRLDDQRRHLANGFWPCPDCGDVLHSIEDAIWHRKFHDAQDYLALMDLERQWALPAFDPDAA